MKLLAIVLISLVILSIVGFIFFSQGETASNEILGKNSENNLTQIEEVKWSFDYDSQKWIVSGTPPSCPEPLIFPSPADVSLASSVLYPGQVRGGDYKPHGGFRYDGLENNEVDVYAPMDGSLFKAAQHLELGEIQYSLYFINDCGIMYKLDHLRELTDKFNDILSTIPMGGEGDSRTTEIVPSVFVEKGEHVATKIGFENFQGGNEGKNIFFDFGVYDLRETNGVEYNSEFRSKHMSIDEYGTHAICWLDYLEEPSRSIVKSLPGTDGVSGKESDYCK